MTFRITYVNRRKPSRVVTEEHFTRSTVLHHVSRLTVGASIEGRYRSAGYARIERLS